MKCFLDLFDISSLKYTTKNILFQIYTHLFFMDVVTLYSMDNELTELEDIDLEHYTPAISKKDIIDIIIAYDIRFIRNFGSDMFYVEMFDGEPLVPMHPKAAYPAGIERLFDLMARERISMISYRDKKLMKSYFLVNSNDL